ncbi:MAG: energy-coupling factor transporter transmembrane protein EcfT, partial [Chloroflexia bacterium]|nr:energy-coupling factor transporter transmembrane protein EcfT [Chloroflexia bacterium]
MSRIDSRAWLLWAGAAMLPALVGRNPVVLLELLAIVVSVHVVWSRAGAFAGVRWFVRIAAAFTLAGVFFNVLTVHAGTTVFARLPERWPVIGGPLTLNALAYGVASGVAL